MSHITQLLMYRIRPPVALVLDANNITFTYLADTFVQSNLHVAEMAETRQKRIHSLTFNKKQNKVIHEGHETKRKHSTTDPRQRKQ